MIPEHPQPDTMRALMVWMLFGAGLVCTALAIFTLLIVWLGKVAWFGLPWPAGTEEQRLSIIGWALLGALGGMGAVIVSLAIGGPVGRIKGRVGIVEIDAEGDR